MLNFNKTILAEPIEVIEIKAMKKDWEVLLLSTLDLMIRRYHRDSSYPYIDMKLSTISGEDFIATPDSSVDFKSRCAVFGWIQGRGLEALVGHARWLKEGCTILSESEIETRLKSLQTMIEKLTYQLEAVRAKNKGHLFFTFSPEGDFFRIDDNGKKDFFKLAEDNSLMSDLFYVKGLNCAARYLKDQTLEGESKNYFKKILEDIISGKFKGDQVSFDPKNKVKAVPGVQGQGSRMIALGGLAIFTDAYPDEAYWSEKGCEFVQHILNKHTNYKHQFITLQRYDFVEKINSDGTPYEEERGILSDPGHALEYIGLSSKFLLALKKKKSLVTFEKETFALAGGHFIPLLVHCFEYGYGANGGGIIKAFDLKGRAPINDDMPWWNLPETIRAAAEVFELFPYHASAPEALDILVKCSNSFFENYVNTNAHMLAFQTIDKNCKPIDVIPATPDADPGYHTGLSIIDALNCYVRYLVS